MKKTLLFLVFLLLPLSVLKSQVVQSWTASYEHNGNDLSRSVAVDGSGNVYVTGESNVGTSDSSFVTIKYNSSGVKQWEVRYVQGTNNSAKSVAISVDNAGNVYVGATASQTGNRKDFLTIKYNSIGAEQWKVLYNGTQSADDELTSMVTDIAGNVYITGASAGTGSGQDYMTIKYNSAGVQQWGTRYNGTYNSTDFPAKVVVDTSGNVYVTGSSTGTISGMSTGLDLLTVKYSPAGAQLWTGRYDPSGINNDQAFSLDVDNSGNVYVVGYNTQSITFHDITVIKYSPAGVRLWVQVYGNDSVTGSPDEGIDIKADKSGNVFVLGRFFGANSSTNYATLKYNSAGTRLWVKIYDHPANSFDTPLALVIDSLSNVYVTGYSKSSAAASDYDIQTLKYSSDGAQLWAIRYDSPAHLFDRPHSIAIDRAMNIYITGQSITNDSQSDFVTIKYSQNPSAVTSTSSEIPAEYFLKQNYPNPFNPNTTIEFSLPENTLVTLKIFDITGREMNTLINEKMIPGSYRYNFNGLYLASGTYFYKLQTAGFTETKKMMMVK